MISLSFWLDFFLRSNHTTLWFNLAVIHCLLPSPHTSTERKIYMSSCTLTPSSLFCVRLFSWILKQDWAKVDPEKAHSMFFKPWALYHITSASTVWLTILIFLKLPILPCSDMTYCRSYSRCQKSCPLNPTKLLLIHLSFRGCVLMEPHFQYEVYSYLPGGMLADEKRIRNVIHNANIHTLLVEYFALHRIKPKHSRQFKSSISTQNISNIWSQS